jgi:branched-chain amino acid transport system ATP-binding protein
MLKERAQQQGRFLSGGEQQMLAIARALVGKHSLILMDEPSEGLSVGAIGQLAETLTKIRESGMTILLVLLGRLADMYGRVRLYTWDLRFSL